MSRSTSPVTIRLLLQSHGDERLGHEVALALKKQPIEGVAWRIAHPEAAALQTRYLGTSQLLDHYDSGGNDPEDQAAAANVAWLGSAIDNPKVAVYDVHNTVVPGLSFLRVGERALKAALGGAFALTGHTKCVIRSDSFSRVVPNAVVIEQSTPTEEVMAPTAQKIHEGLSALTDKDAAELSELCDKIIPRLTFLRPRPVLTQAYLASPEYDVTIETLESFPEQPPFMPLDLPPEVCADLGVSADSTLLAGSWGHNNMSPEQPEFGFHNGAPRRLIFGEFFEQVPPPKADDTWLYAA